VSRLVPVLLLWPLLAAAGVPVTTASLAELVSRPVYSAPASVVARNTPALASEINARIEALPVRVGDVVESGTLVARLDCRLFRSQLAAAEAGLDQLVAQRDFAARQLERALELQAKRGISDEFVDQRQSELRGLESQIAGQREAIRQAEIQVDRCDVRTPFTAVVTARLASEGSLATPGTQLLQIVQLDDLEVRAALREGEAEDLGDADGPVLIWQDRTYPLELRVLVPVVEEKSRTREARLSFSADMAPSGAAGRLQWRGARPLLPPEYVVRRGGQLGIFRVNDGEAHFHPLPQALEGQPATVDLPADTRIVVEGRHRLTDGDPVAE
jgi:RND family efflux transporter MFP subunit